MLDYKLLEALALVVEEGGFEKAAARLHITQSAVSHRVRQLEEQAGQVLLARTTPPRPTPAGREMLRHWAQVRLLEEDLARAISPGGAAQEEGYTSLPVAVNADSLATWFLRAVESFLEEERVALDLRVDDQEQTHRMLRDGEVLGCVSVEPRPMQGCRVEYLGREEYRLLASPAFAARWFPRGLDASSVARAPMLVYNRKDNLQANLLRMALGRAAREADGAPVHYVPSTDGFEIAILDGLAYGSIPDQLAAPYLEDGRMVDLAPGVRERVELHWHYWNIRSPLLERFSAALARGAGGVLERT